MSRSLNNNGSSKKGFTLVEIAVASLIAFVLFQAVYQLFFSTLKSNRVHEEYTTKIMDCRKILLKVQRQLIESRAILYPTSPLAGGSRSTKVLIYKDEVGLVKTISFYKDSAQLRLHTFDLQNSALIQGDLEPQPGGELEVNPRYFMLGENLDDISFTVNSSSIDTLQIRISIDGYHLLGGVRLLNG